ncbi:hypothetical protein D7Y55_03055 [Stenotrophomonas maltophilia]|nr:hypothetical protein [Stenotrophomonas maltophilia]
MESDSPYWQPCIPRGAPSAHARAPASSSHPSHPRYSARHCSRHARPHNAAWLERAKAAMKGS